MTHTALYPNYANLAWDIIAGRDWLVSECGIAKEDAVGFRAPYLAHDPSVCQVLFENGFLYDSSIGEVFPFDTSPDSANRLWPYTMDYGIPQIPLPDMQGADSSDCSTMDPTAGSVVALYQQFVANLLFSYHGNRAPMGIYTHAPWYTAGHTGALRKFVAYALALPDVWFVTSRQLVDYMRAPVHKNKMGGFLTCNAVYFTDEAPKPCQTYTVKQTDSLWSVSALVGVTVDELIAANPDVANPTIYAGQRFFAGPACRNHTVAPGDSLYYIAASYSVGLADLLAANPAVSVGAALMPGTALHIPPGRPAVPWSVLLDLILAGCNQSVFVSSKQAMFTAALAAIAELPAAQVSPPSLQASPSSPQTEVSMRLHTQNATATQAVVFTAQQLGLSSTLAALGLSLVSANTTAEQVTTSPPPSPAPPVASPTPAPAAASSSGGDGSSRNLGAILGGALGGGLGGQLVLGAVGLYLVRRRRNKGSDLRATDGLRVQYDGSAPHGSIAVLTVTLQTQVPKGEAAIATTPRAATHRR
ncbi:hypothetical protein N2152v2_000507 [Parachlorella kessleri]